MMAAGMIVPRYRLGFAMVPEAPGANAPLAGAHAVDPPWLP